MLFYFFCLGRDLSEALGSLPEILSKKANLEAHTNILHAVMKQIAAREVPTYFELEQEILTSSGRGVDKAGVISILKDGSKGKLSDKARLLALTAVAAAADGSSTKALADEYDIAFTLGCSAITTNTPSQETIQQTVRAIAFLRRLLSLQSSSITAKFGASGGISGANSSNAYLSSFLTSATSRATSLMAKAASFFTKFTPFYVTRVVYNLAEGKSCPEDDTFCYLDPRARGNSSGVAAAASSAGLGDVAGDHRGQRYSEVIVFVMGGGSYSEFYNLQELLKDKAAGTSLRQIIYGCTDLISGDDFIAQLEKLATAGGQR